MRRAAFAAIGLSGKSALTDRHLPGVGVTASGGSRMDLGWPVTI